MQNDAFQGSFFWGGGGGSNRISIGPPFLNAGSAPELWPTVIVHTLGL